MDLYSLVYIITAGALVGLLIAVLLNRRDRTAVTFSLLLSAILGWVVTLYLFYTFTEPTLVLFFGRLNFVAASLLGGFLFLFIFYYPRPQSALGNLVKLLFVLENLAFAYITQFTGLIVLDEIVDGANRVTVYGELYLLFIVHFIGFILLALGLLVRKYRNAQRLYSQLEITQIRILIWGLVLSVATGLFASVLIPLVFTALGLLGTPLYFIIQNLAPLATLIFSSTIAYTIIRHRFLDIRVLIGRIIYLTTVATFPYVAFFLLVFVYQQAFGTVFHPTVYFLSVFIGIGFVMTFNEINRYIRNQVNSRLINPGYDPLETNDRFGRDLSLIVKLQDIVTRMTDVVSRTIRPAAFWLYLLPLEEKPEVLLNHQQFDKLPRLAQLCLMVWQNVGKHPLVIDEFKIETERGGLFVNIISIIKELEELMLDQDIKVILSMDGSEGIIGFYAFGMKEADSPYTTQDIEFITSLVNTASLAINRSLLYAEVQDFAASLQRKVDEATAELKETNAKLESTLIEVQDARRKEQDMVDIMGHELRTPMSIVRNAVKVLLFEIRKPSEVKRDFFEKYLEMAFESAKREITLIETLLSATKLDASRVQLHFTRIDAKDIVHDSLEGQRAILSERNMQVEYHEPKGVFDVFADRTRIQEVMDNFLSNAVKYTPKGKVKINLWKDSDYVWISITDQGIGIGADDLQNLGKKFFRAKQYVRVEGKDQIIRPGGTGLGLYVSFELTRLIGGLLYINSQVGKGSTFTFSIPLYKDQPDKQIDQTFDTPEETNQRRHVIIGGNPPTPPADMEYETPEPVLFPSQEDIAAHMATMKAQP